MSDNAYRAKSNITLWVSPLRGALHGWGGPWLRCSSLEWNDHCASLRLALNDHNRTLHPVQLPVLGSMCSNTLQARPMRRIHTDLFDINSYVPLPGTPLFDAVTPAQQARIDWKRAGYKSLDNPFFTRVDKGPFQEFVTEAYHIAEQAQQCFEARMATMKTASQASRAAPGAWSPGPASRRVEMA